MHPLITQAASVSSLWRSCQAVQQNEAFLALQLMTHHHTPLSRSNVHSLLQECIKRKDLVAGRRVYASMVLVGLDSVVFLSDYLIRLFTLCGSLVEANRVFWKLAEPSVYTWNAIISAHTLLGQEERALILYHKMRQCDVKPNRVTFLSLLKACCSIKDLKQGRLIHNHVSRSGLGADVIIGNALIDMYAKCGRLEEAHIMFSNLPHRDVVSWSAIITGYVQQGYGISALELFEKMQQEGTKPDKVIFLSILKACGITEAIEQGRKIHSQIIQSGCELDMVIGSALVNMYCKCGSLEEARKVFDGLPKRNVVSWGAMIAGYAQQGHGLCALGLFTEMQQEGIKPDIITFPCILKACSSTGAIGEGRLIHEEISKSGLGLDVVIGSALIDLYVKCGSLEEARKIFDELPEQNVVSWGAMIAGYAEHGHGLLALQFFEKMLQEHIVPSEVLLLCILQACGSLAATGQGRLIHDQIIRAKLASDVIGSSLVDMYAKCGSLEEARRMFDSLRTRDVVCWGTMISGYAENGHGGLALELFYKLQQEGINPDKVIFLCVLKACCAMQSSEQGKLIHEKIIKCGLASDVIENAILDMYVKCESLEDAHKVLNELPARTVVSWSALIAGYAEHGSSALELYEKMQQESIKPNKVTYLCLLKACGIVGAVGQGRLVHDQVVRNGLALGLGLGSMLVDMYARCGSLDEAHIMFDKLPNRDAVSWGAMITGYSQHGNSVLAMQCFDDMQREGLKPNHAIFTSILSACSNAGLLEEGWLYFNSMNENYGIIPSLEHHGCMVDLLGRVGHLTDAEYLLQTLPVPPNSVIWTSLLSSCKTYGNMELGKRCFDEIVNLNPHDASACTLMSSVLAGADMWEHADRMHELRKRAGIQKEAGRAWIENRNIVNEFVVGSLSHPQCDDDMYVKLMRVNKLMKRTGFVPQVDVVMDFVR